MSTTKDGGPAFPNNDDFGNMIYGMSLRDWFAGQALAGIVSRSGSYDATGAALEAYFFADAMLRAREGGAR